MTDPEYIISEGQMSDIERYPYDPVTRQIIFKKVRARTLASELKDEREKVNKIFDHARALCDAIIEKLDCQSKLGFNALIIKRDIESLRAGKDGEGND